MKAKECTLIINNSWGYTYTPIQCKSITEAKQKGWEFFGGFCFKVIVGKKVVYKGYCEKY